ncbi:MAG: hypothetical protein WCL04_05915 [Verrucomicrobiota bacterium]
MCLRAANLSLFPRQAVSACLALLLLATAGEANAQARRPGGDPPGYWQGKPDQEHGRKILEAFRQNGWGLGGAYYLEFELRVLPRRGDERTVPGQMWGGRNDHGPLSRIVLQPGEKDAERRLLVQVGTESKVWSWPAEGVNQLGGGSELGVAALFRPLAGTDLTAFDLQMPFLYWPDFAYEGVAPVLGNSPANVFLLRPPAAIRALRPELSGVRVWLDGQYNALLKAEQLGRDDRPLKSIEVLDLIKVDVMAGGKKTDEQWIVKRVDVRDEATRNKTQFVVTGAALGLALAPALFEPARLSDTIAPPAADQVRRIRP